MLTRLSRAESARGALPGYIRRALLVDDDHQLRLNLSDDLIDIGVAVELSDGRNVSELIARFDPDLVLLDVRLGSSDAFSIIRSEIPPDYRGVVSVVSGSGLDVIMDITLLGEKRGLHMGPPLTKPYGLEDLYVLVSAVDDLFERQTISKAARHSEEVAPVACDLRLRQALEQRRLEIWYQPKYETGTGRMSGAEALIRARSATGDLVKPYTLLKDASKDDLLDLTEFVLAGAVEHTALLGAAGWHERLSVNVPLSYLSLPDPARLLRTPARRANWPGMIFEVTEDEALGEDGDIEFVASQLKLYSVALSIDDFGAGHSSLARLRDLPFSELKLDRSFVRGCATDSVKQSICRSVLALGAELGLSTVAEGVESEAEMSLCVEWGCDQVQGFLLAKPMPFVDLLRLVQEHSLQLVRLAMSSHGDPAA